MIASTGYQGVHPSVRRASRAIESSDLRSQHPTEILDVAFSPDGNRIASISWDDQIQVWNARTKTLVMSIQGPAKHVRGCGADIFYGSYNDAQIFFGKGDSRLYTIHNDTKSVWDLDLSLIHI